MRTARYGVGVRKRLDSVKRLRSRKYKCPQCRKLSMKRLYGGVWKCKRCGLEIADGAYSMTVKSLN